MPNVEDTKNQIKSGVKKDEPVAPTSGSKPSSENKPEVNPRTLREMDAGKKALDRRKEELDKAEKARDK